MFRDDTHASASQPSLCPRGAAQGVGPHGQEHGCGRGAGSVFSPSLQTGLHGHGSQSRSLLLPRQRNSPRTGMEGHRATCRAPLKAACPSWPGLTDQGPTRPGSGPMPGGRWFSKCSLSKTQEGEGLAPRAVGGAAWTQLPTDGATPSSPQLARGSLGIS